MLFYIAVYKLFSVVVFKIKYRGEFYLIISRCFLSKYLQPYISGFVSLNIAPTPQAIN